MPRLLHIAHLLALVAMSAPAWSADPPAAGAPKFELRDSDRVVFLGDTLIEREQKSGYWETMLTARYPNRRITFRNLGWDGDTVWAESRGYFDEPQVGYRRLIDHVRRIKPTVVFLAYGNNEAFAGREGVPRFVRQYEKLLDDLGAASEKDAEFIVLGPLGVDSDTSPLPRDVAERQDRMHAEYATHVRELAERRKLRHVELHSALRRAKGKALVDLTGQARRDEEDGSDWPAGIPRLTEQGLHLTPAGYWYLGREIVQELVEGDGDIKRLPVARVRADGADEGREEQGVSVADVVATFEVVRFRLTFDRLPYPPLPFAAVDEKRPARTTLFLSVRGGSSFVPISPIKNVGLRIDGQKVPISSRVVLRDGQTVDWTETAGGWRWGHSVVCVPELNDAEQLRRAIVAKNELYYHHWRPQNITYLFGFRKHEQGQNAREVEEFETLVAEKDAEIHKLKQPVPHTYELVRVEDEE